MVGRWERRSWETSVSVKGENEGRQGARTERGGGRVWGGGEGGPDVCNLLIEEAKSSAVMED